MNTLSASHSFPMASSSGSEYEPEQPVVSPPSPKKTKPRKKSIARKNPQPSNSSSPPPPRPRKQPRTTTTHIPPPQPQPQPREEEEEPVTHTAPTPTQAPPLDTLRRWFPTDAQIQRFLSKFYKRTAIDPVWFNLDWFLSNDFFFFTNYLINANLTDFITIQEPYYPMLTRAFYSTFEYNPDTTTITASVKNVKIRISQALWCQLTGLQWVGEETNGNVVPPIWAEEYTPEIAQRAICHCNAAPRGRTLTAGNLTLTSRLLHFVVAKILLAREGNFTTVYLDDRLCIWALLKGKNINWAYLVLQYMIRVVNSDLPLPYGMLVTKILKHFKVPLEGEEVYSTEKWPFQFGSRNINMAKIRRVGDEWVLRDHGAHGNQSMEDFPEHFVPPSARTTDFAGSSSTSAPVDTATLLERLSLQMQKGFDDNRSQHLDQRQYIDQQVGALRVELQAQLRQQHEDQKEYIHQQFLQQQQFLISQFQANRAAGSFWDNPTFSDFDLPTPQTQPHPDPHQDPPLDPNL